MGVPGTHSEELKRGERFAFGENWARFLAKLGPERIRLAEQSLLTMLEVQTLQGQRFLDAGSGSGLFSLAARNLGATVHSFDYDPQSVACTQALKDRFHPGDPQWVVQAGSVLDPTFIASLGVWDVVYSWGVLHHTGAMGQAFEQVAGLVADGGRLFIAIYNDQGRRSASWLRVKQAYHRLPRGLRWLILGPVLARLWGPDVLRDSLRGHPLKTWRSYPEASLRGMSAWSDLVDWVGGLPFEVATPERVFSFFRDRNFRLEALKTCRGSLGCNEYVFRKV